MRGLRSNIRADACRHCPSLAELKKENEVTIKVTIWNEGRHEKLHPDVAAIYPSGIHGAIAAGLKNEGFALRCASLDDPDEGLGEQLLDDTDVLL
jgi:trehalose utilization protein